MLQRLLDEIGKSSFYLNTIVVGLDAVEKGHAKPTELDVKWEPADRTLAARMARHSAVEAFMVRAAEALQIFLKAFAALPRFGHIAEKWTRDTGAAEKLDDLGSLLLGKNSYLVAAGMLLIAWRNRIVHGGTFAFPGHKRSVLLNNKEKIHDAYRNLDTLELLNHAREGRPTLKDASSIIAMTINLARAMDEHVYGQLEKDDVLAWIKHYSLDGAIRKIIRETAPDKVSTSVKRLFTTNAPRLYADFARFCDEKGGDFIDT